MENYTHYIAIDFGTYGCGIASSTIVDQSDKVRVYSNWVQSKMAMKCPTVLLLDDEGKFEAFGDTALKNYQTKNGLRRPDKVNEYYLFDRFKMCLLEKELTRDLKIKAANGKELPAVTIITITLKYLKNLILKEINDQVGPPIRGIQWILTVPAIWTEAAKQIMRETATEAGLTQGGDSLKLFLEPEAAAMCCLREICNIESDMSAPTSDEVNYYLLADCGGGTIDVVSHKLTRKPNREIHIEEIHPPHGGPYGGFAVNDEFEKMLQKMLQLSAKDLIQMKTEHSRHWNALLGEFEIAKRAIDPQKPYEVFTIAIQKALRKTIESIKRKTISELVKEYKRHDVNWDENESELVLPYGTMDQLLSPVASKIMTILTEVLQKPECMHVNKIILVGGFAESSILFSKIEKFIGVKYQVKRSITPWLSVLKGAVMCARHDLIRSRKMTQTLGIETWDEFKPGFHREDKKITVDGKCLCINKFTKFVEVNESVEVSKTFEHIYPPADKDQDHCKIKIYGCYHSKPIYTDGAGCYPVGVIDVDLTKCDNERPKQIRVIMHVSGTEINVSAYASGVSHQLPVHLDLVVGKYIEKRN